VPKPIKLNLENYSDNFFEVNHKNGFLPKDSPLAVLPKKYTELQVLIDEMPIKKDDGTDGLLSRRGGIEEAIGNLSNLKHLVSEEEDVFLIQALFRAYSFLTSAYLLAPAHFNYIETKKYGKAHTVLPSQIAEPFVIVSEKLDVYPFIDYHYSYSLGNFIKIDKSKGYEWENLAMAAKFSGMDDERGFIMLHVDINQHSPELVGSILDYLKADEEKSVNLSLSKCLSAMKKINERRQVMWQASRWKHYNDFRVFIMGIKGNDEIFGDGVIYEGVSDKPVQYRGQTGAQDNIIPTADIFTGVIGYYPTNDLTKYLLDLRSYRPKCIQNFLSDIKDEMGDNRLFNNLKESENEEGFCLLLQILDEIYYFRNGHWQFVQKYIMANTKYAKATGGTPIISWIPNQITAVLNYMSDVIDLIPTGTKHLNKDSYLDSINKKKDLLNKQLQLLHGDDYNADEVFSLNKKMNLNDD
jgi:indoleamine 2,3-dioxygenase